MLATPLRLTTERLVLREITATDLRALLAIESRPEQVRYQSFDAHTEDTARAYIAAVMADASASPRLVYDLAITRDGGELVGRAGFRRDASDPRLGELWFNVAPELTGQGLATEAARAIVTFAFRELGMHRMWGDCDPRNPASARVMERLGMRREGHHVQNVFLKGEWCDSLIYAVLASEWR
jgi:ribosomal-protein-alanine N-acetyltransferase